MVERRGSQLFLGQKIETCLTWANDSGGLSDALADRERSNSRGRL